MKRALFLPKKKSHLPAVVKIINDFFNLEKQKPSLFQDTLTPFINGI